MKHGRLAGFFDRECSDGFVMPGLSRETNDLEWRVLVDRSVEVDSLGSLARGGGLERNGSFLQGPPFDGGSRGEQSDKYGTEDQRHEGMESQEKDPADHRDNANKNDAKNC